MAFTIRPLHTDEQKYTYRQSTQIEGQTGSIGYLRGDFGAGGKEFFSSWFDHRRDLKTDEFKSALDEVINALRSEEYGLLNSRTAMAQYAEKYTDSAFQGNYATEYGFRADTEKHAFLIRCNPARGDYNFYCYCYVREWLDRHMEKASRGIRFITPDYKEKFKIPDGDKIRITLSDGEQLDRTCRYIDDYNLLSHLRVRRANGAKRQYRDTAPFFSAGTVLCVRADGKLRRHCQKGRKRILPHGYSGRQAQ